MNNLRNVARVGLAGSGGLILLLVMLLSVEGLQARPATAYYYVHEGESIQAAIDQAEAGDQIWITGGVYTENVSITKSIALRGSWDVAFTAQNWVTPTTLGEHSERRAQHPRGGDHTRHGNSAVGRADAPQRARWPSHLGRGRDGRTRCHPGRGQAGHRD